MKRISFFIVVLIAILTSCESKPRYEYHSDDYRTQVVFDNQTGKVYYRIIGQEWEVSDPINNNTSNLTADTDIKAYKDFVREHNLSE